MGDCHEAPLYYALVCVYCERSVLVAEQIDDAELEEMADHLRAEHPGVVRNERAPEFGEVIRHFRLSLA